jgi:hypothetical protein
MALIANLVRGAFEIRWSNLGTGSVVDDEEDTIKLSERGPGTPSAYTITLNVPTWMTGGGCGALLANRRPRGQGRSQAVTFAQIEWQGQVFYGIDDDGALELVG